uniref:phage tail tube protein n=1 Tax=Streptosporangium sp. CA-235898 TaxID=3240073 RepID=UPI003F499766
MATTDLFVPLLSRVWLAPVGTAAPAGPTIAMDEDWRDVGHFTPDSLNWETSPEFEEAKSAQSDYAIASWQTGDGATLEVDLYEWTGANFQAVFGGGTITKITPAGDPAPPPYFKFVPPKVGARDEVAVVVELINGGRHMRRIIPRAQQVEGVTQSLNKTEASILPLRLKVLGSDLADPFYDLSDFDSFDPTP